MKEDKRLFEKIMRSGHKKAFKKQNSKAYYFYSRAIEVNKYSGKAYYYRAKVAKNKQAMKDFRKAILLGFKNEDAYLQLGQLYESANRNSKALITYSLGIKANPYSKCLLLRQRGIYYHKHNLYTKALKNYFKSLKCSKTVALKSDNYASIGRIYVKLNENEKAIKAFKKAKKFSSIKKRIIYSHSGKAIGLAHDRIKDY